VIAEGTPAELKQRYSGDTIAITPSLLPADLRSLEHDLAGSPFVRSARTEDGSIRLSVTGTTQAMAAVFGLLADRGIGTRAASFAQPSLDDVFLRETGRSLRDTGAPAEPAPAETAQPGEKVPA
jgi:ABC-2 type transport system ATP-binding protein